MISLGLLSLLITPKIGIRTWPYSLLYGTSILEPAKLTVLSILRDTDNPSSIFSLIVELVIFAQVLLI